MLKTSWNKWLACGLVGASAACGAGLTAAQEAPKQSRAVRALAEAGSDFLFKLVADDEDQAAEAPPRSDYWIGIALGELPELAKIQLGVEDGLVVSEVVEDSPAAKARLQAHDILLKAGDARLATAADLIKAVDAAKDKELTVLIIRGGKEQTLKVTPIKRPKSENVLSVETRALEAPADVKVEIEKLEEALNQLKLKAGSGPLGIMLARPGVVPPMALPQRVDVLKTNELPKNLSISITKKGDEPAKIRVERDGKTWDVTEDKLDELPEDVRPHVHQFLGHRVSLRLPAGMSGARAALAGPDGQRFEYRVTPPAAGAAPGAPPVPPMPPRAGIRSYAPAIAATPVPPTVARLHRVETAGVEAKLETILKKLEQIEGRSLEQLEKEVKQLRKELDELRGKSPGERE
jgi:hypothetical protein